MRKDKPVLRPCIYGWTCGMKGAGSRHGGHTPELAYRSWAWGNRRLAARNTLRAVK